MSPPLEVLTILVELFAKLFRRLDKGMKKPCTYLQALLGSNCIWVSVLGLWVREPFHD